MSMLVWNAPKERSYENGVDHGVLYLKDVPGVVWNGITNVAEATVGAERTSYSLDGLRFLNSVSGRDFQATVSAITVPPEFGVCIGEVPIVKGFFLTRQPREMFGMSYRTRVNGDAGYKIHLVYNATATPSKRGYSTRGSSVSPTTHEWVISAVPPPSTTYRPSAHLTIDSLESPADSLAALESMLYGTPDTDPYLPSPDVIVDLFNPRSLL